MFRFWRTQMAISVSVQHDGGCLNNIHCLKKNLNASRPSEHPSVGGESVKTFRWDHRLQRQNLFMAFKRVPRW